MRGRVTWLFILALGAPWAWGQELPRPQVLPPQKKPAIDPADKDAPDRGKEKDKEKEGKDKEKNDHPLDDKAAAPSVPPIYFPLEVFPPAPPAVMDPRTGAWEQVQGGQYQMMYNPNLPCGHSSSIPVQDIPPNPPHKPPIPVRADSAGPLQQVGWKAPPPSGRTIRFAKDPRTGGWVMGELKPQR